MLTRLAVRSAMVVALVAVYAQTAAAQGMTDAYYARQGSFQEETYANTNLDISLYNRGEAQARLAEAQAAFELQRSYMESQELWLTISEIEDSLAQAVTKLSESDTWEASATSFYAGGVLYQYGGSGATDWGNKAWDEQRWAAAYELYMNADGQWAGARHHYYQAYTHAYTSLSYSEHALELIP